MKRRFHSELCYIVLDDGATIRGPKLRCEPVVGPSLLFRLDYISCLFTVLSTILVGRRRWQGWIVAGANSVLICVIAVRTSQTGFIPANVFCLAIYGYNVVKWRADGETLREGSQGSQLR